MIHAGGKRSCDGCGMVSDVLIVRTVYSLKPFHAPTYKVETCPECPLTRGIVIRADRRKPTNGPKETR